MRPKNSANSGDNTEYTATLLSDETKLVNEVRRTPVVKLFATLELPLRATEKNPKKKTSHHMKTAIILTTIFLIGPHMSTL